MDVSKKRQKYKRYTCLCVSVMGQRRFRVSMGVLIASPEAGDASGNIIPQIRKGTPIFDNSSKSFMPAISQRNMTNPNALISTSNYNSTNSINREEYEQMILMENSIDDMSTSTILDKCQFPYYRSNRNGDRYSDAVLVKDVGVSCLLLNQNMSEMPIPGTKTLVKQLKREYTDLSNITTKITAYTKDILDHLAIRNKRKHQLLKDLVTSKHAMASQYIDSKDNLCLKLRLFSNVGTQCTTQTFQNSDDLLYKNKGIPMKLYGKHSKNRISEKDRTMYGEGVKLKYEKNVQTRIYKKHAETNTSNLSLPSNSSVYNYLVMNKQETPNRLLNSELTKFDNTLKRRNYKSFSDNTDYRDHSKKCNPVVFTNWKEISKSKQSKTKTQTITSNALQKMEITKNKILQEKSLKPNTTNNTPNTKFHTVNIQIVKQNKKHA
ncbi:hypothetical protein ANTRET_LOCUS10029 [Anthophora retusa]